MVDALPLRALKRALPVRALKRALPVRAVPLCGSRALSSWDSEASFSALPLQPCWLLIDRSGMRGVERLLALPRALQDRDGGSVGPSDVVATKTRSTPMSSAAEARGSVTAEQPATPRADIGEQDRELRGLGTKTASPCCIVFGWVACKVPSSSPPMRSALGLPLFGAVPSKLQCTFALMPPGWGRGIVAAALLVLHPLVLPLQPPPLKGLLLPFCLLQAARIGHEAECCKGRANGETGECGLLPGD